MYSDFQCRECANFVLNVEPQIIDTYIKNGQVKMVYHHVTTLGNISTRAAEASECASEQGRFWEMRYALYQRQVEVLTIADTDGFLRSLVRLVNMEPTAFAGCLEERGDIGEVLRQNREATEGGVTEVPAFEVNGQKASGAVTAAQLEQLLGSAQ